jgi:hypothetical protein
MSQVNHISLSDDSRHTFSLLISTYSEGGHSAVIVSFDDEQTAEAVYRGTANRHDASALRLYKTRSNTS